MSIIIFFQLKKQDQLSIVRTLLKPPCICRLDWILGHERFTKAYCSAWVTHIVFVKSLESNLLVFLVH